MSGYGGCDDESLHAIILAENEIERVRALNAAKSLIPVREFCKDCDEPIPLKRQQLIAGCQYCVECAPNHESVQRTKMLTYIL